MAFGERRSTLHLAALESQSRPHLVRLPHELVVHDARRKAEECLHAKNKRCSKVSGAPQSIIPSRSRFGNNNSNEGNTHINALVLYTVYTPTTSNRDFAAARG